MATYADMDVTPEMVIDSATNKFIPYQYQNGVYVKDIPTGIVTFYKGETNLTFLAKIVEDNPSFNFNNMVAWVIGTTV